jgi:hypothetical protein
MISVTGLYNRGFLEESLAREKGGDILGRMRVE